MENIALKITGLKENEEKKRLKKILPVTLAVLFLLYIGLANILVSAALVPSFMERLEAFSRITEESVDALVHTDDIQQQYEQQKEKKQPGGQGLEEILLKSTEKGLGGSVEIPFDAAQHTVVQSSQRRADGENWNAAEYKEKIAYDHISNLI